MSRGVLVGVVAVVVVVLIILGLFLGGLIPGLGSSSTPGGGKTGPSYYVNFTESGVPAANLWYLNITGGPSVFATGATTTLSTSLQNGTYDFAAASSGYSAAPATGSVVVNGGPKSQSLAFTKLAANTYQVTFSETGLPASTSWSVTFNGSSMSSPTASIVFISGDGTWAFTVGTVPGYTSAPSSGTVDVAGAAKTQDIAFSASGGGGGGGQESYSQAAPVAQTAAGSGWSPIFAFGVDFTASYTNTTSRGNTTCPVTGGSSTWPTIPAYTGNYHDGLLTGWIFLYYQASSVTEKAVYVAGSSATVLGEVTGSSCTFSDSKLVALGAGIIDSTTVASILSSNSTIAAFVAHNSTASAYYFLVSGNASNNAFWVVNYTTCTPGVSGNGFEVEGLVNATSGAIRLVYASPATCGTTPFAPHVGENSNTLEPAALSLRGMVRID